MVAKTTTMDPRLVERDGKAIFARSNGDLDEVSVIDTSWARQAFLLGDNQLTDPVDIVNRYWSTADAKFTDTRLGCNIGINPKPQFTPYSDIRSRGRLAGRQNVNLSSTSGNLGMGRYYSEAFDDPKQTIYMRFGVPQFNSLTNFMTRAFDPGMSTLARTGRAQSIFYDAGKLIGTVAAVAAFPGVAALVSAGKLINFFFRRPTSKYYTLKPAMHLYWSTVSTLVNSIAINKGIFPKIMAEDASGARIGRPFTFDQDYLNKITSLMPDVFRGQNNFDMFSIAGRAQRLANQMFDEEYKALGVDSSTNYAGYLKKELTGNGTHSSYISNNKGEPTWSSIRNKLLSFGYYISKPEKDSRMETDPRIDVNDPKGAETATKEQDSIANYLDSEFRDGTQFATFNVDYTGPIGESFSNSVVESDISQKLNSTSSQVRQARFTFAEGNIIGGVAGDAVGAIAGAAVDVATGVLDGASMGFASLLKGLAGEGYIDIPKHWQSSTASLPKTTYSMTLISPYGNPISQMINIYIPLCMLLAAALPLSTGKQSYTSPFLCQLYDRGRSTIRLGMVESLSIERAITNLGFNVNGSPLGIKVSFSVVDLSSIMHMPISSGSVFDFDVGLDEDNILADYLSVLAGQDMYSQIYAFPKAKLRAAKVLMGLGKVTSPAYWASLTHESLTSGMLNNLTFGASGAVVSVLEGAVRGNQITSGPVPTGN